MIRFADFYLCFTFLQTTLCFECYCSRKVLTLYKNLDMFQMRLTPRKYCSQILLANIAHKYCWKSGTACECLNCRSTFPIDVKMLKDMTLHRVSGNKVDARTRHVVTRSHANGMTGLLCWYAHKNNWLWKRVPSHCPFLAITVELCFSNMLALFFLF